MTDIGIAQPGRQHLQGQVITLQGGLGGAQR
jgi:hypothetical protein